MAKIDIADNETPAADAAASDLRPHFEKIRAKLQSSLAAAAASPEPLGDGDIEQFAKAIKLTYQAQGAVYDAFQGINHLL